MLALTSTCSTRKKIKKKVSQDGKSLGTMTWYKQGHSQHRDPHKRKER
jgi:hypothetical protein